MRIIYAFLLVGFTLGSCMKFVKKKYQLEKKLDMKSKSEYLSYLNKKTGFHPDHIYYIDATRYMDFIDELKKTNSSFIYRGVLQSDSGKLLCYEPKTFDCIGNIERYIKGLIKKDSIQEKVEFITDTIQMKLRRIYDNRSFSYSKFAPQKEIHFLLYHHDYGNYYFPFYKRLNSDSSIREHLYLICMDPIHALRDN